jgi:ATP-dependent Clp protease ATP-binding subunit ClpA
VGAAHLAAGLLTEPEGLAAKVIGRAGLTGEQLIVAVGAGPAPAAPGADLAALQELSFTADGKAALKDSLKAALRLGHNYLGTEHLLLGVLAAGGHVGHALAAAGLDRETAEQLLASEFADLQARRTTG